MRLSHKEIISPSKYQALANITEELEEGEVDVSSCDDDGGTGDLVMQQDTLLDKAAPKIKTIPKNSRKQVVRAKDLKRLGLPSRHKKDSSRKQ